jgi:hypothetical protein
VDWTLRWFFAVKGRNALRRSPPNLAGINARKFLKRCSIPLVLFAHCPSPPKPPPGGGEHWNSRLWTTLSGQKYQADLASPSYRGSGVFCAAHIFVDRSVTRVQSANLDFTSSAISLTDARVAEGAELTNSNLGMRVVRQRSVKLVKSTPPQKQPSRVR